MLSSNLEQLRSLLLGWSKASQGGLKIIDQEKLLWEATKNLEKSSQDKDVLNLFKIFQREYGFSKLTSIYEKFGKGASLSLSEIEYLNKCKGRKGLTDEGKKVLCLLEGLSEEFVPECQDQGVVSERQDQGVVPECQDQGVVKGEIDKRGEENSTEFWRSKLPILSKKIKKDLKEKLSLLIDRLEQELEDLEKAMKKTQEKNVDELQNRMKPFLKHSLRSVSLIGFCYMVHRVIFGYSHDKEDDQIFIDFVIGSAVVFATGSALATKFISSYNKKQNDKLFNNKKDVFIQKRKDLNKQMNILSRSTMEYCGQCDYNLKFDEEDEEKRRKFQDTIKPLIYEWQCESVDWLGENGFPTDFKIEGSEVPDARLDHLNERDGVSELPYYQIRRA